VQSLIALDQMAGKAFARDFAFRHLGLDGTLAAGVERHLERLGLGAGAVG